MFRLFFDCNYIKTLNIEKWNTSNVNVMGYMFANCSSLQSVNLKNLDTSSCNNFFDMFGNCMSLTSLDVSQFKTSNIKNAAWMFYNTTSLKELKGFESWDLSQVNDISWMFACSGLSEIHFPKSGDILAINDVFNTCENLISVDLSKLNLNDANDWQEAFQKCPKLQTIYVADDFLNKSATSQNTFYNCTSLIGGAGTKYDPTFIDSTGARIDGGVSSPGYFTAISQKPIETGTVLNIEGSDYIVMGQTEGGNYRLISGTSIGNIQYQPNQDSSGNYKLNVSDEPDKKRYDGKNSNTYENSYIDRYLENTWYKNLPASMQKAIQETKIKQISYTDSTTNPKWKFFDPEGGTNKYWYYNEGDEIEPNWVIYNKAKIPDNESGTYPYRYWSQKDAFDNEIYNSISRHVFLPCVEDIYNIVDLNNANKIRDFLNSTDNHLNYIWLRDAYSNSSQTAIYLDYNTRSMDNYYVTSKAMGIRPAFVIDLSKIDYTVTGTVNYK